MHAAHYLFRSALRFPDRPLWMMPEGTISYREGAGRVAQLAHGLLGIGEPGDRIAILSTNRLEGLECLLGILTAGMTSISMNMRMTVQECIYLLRDCEPRAVVFTEEFRDLINQVRVETPTVAEWICVGKPQREEHAYEEILKGQPCHVPWVKMGPDDLAELFYTSGTTGKPKGVMETHRNLIMMTQQFLLGLMPDLNENDVMLHTAPISHASGIFMFPHLAVGAANAFPLSMKFHPQKFFEAVALYGVTTTKVVPTIINSLVQSGLAVKYDWSTLRYIFYGGAPMLRAHLQEALKVFGPILAQNYGQGEAPSACTSLTKQEHVVDGDEDKLRRLGSVGRELPGTRIQIVDKQDRPLPPFEIGEIVISGDLIMRGYWRQPEATAETLRNGWLHTGDVGYLDNAGYLFITSRVKDMIISGGFNIYSREVEEAISTHPDVKEVAVLGIEDERWGETVKAVVVKKNNSTLTEDAVVAHCLQVLPSFKKPRSVDFVDELPKNSNGKVDKREIAKRLGDGRSPKLLFGEDDDLESTLIRR